MLPLGDSVDPGMSKSRTQSLETKTGFHAPGGQVYAVQYRKVHFSMFTRRKVDRSWLQSGNRWKVYVGSRVSMEEVDDDGIEANLSDVDGQQIAEVDGDNCGVFEVNGESMLYYW